MPILNNWHKNPDGKISGIYSTNALANLRVQQGHHLPKMSYQFSGSNIPRGNHFLREFVSGMGTRF